MNHRYKSKTDITRSALAVEAFQQALGRLDEMERERRQVAGYRKVPPKAEEFDIPETDHAWGDGPWSTA